MALVWTDEMVAALRSLRARGCSLYICAEEIGVGYSTCVYKARELGLAGRLNAGRKPGSVKPGEIADLGLSTRTTNTLRQAKITSISQLLKLSDYDLLLLPDFGTSSLLQVKWALRKIKETSS